MGQLDDKTALITGGARGFGRATALLLAREGANVAVADIGQNLPSARFSAMATVDQLQRTVEEIQAVGRQAIGIQADVTRSEDCRRMAETVLNAFGRIDILFANAGVFTMGRAWELSEEEWDLLMAVNLKGMWLTTKFVVPHMIERRCGKIVMTSSRNGLKVEPNYAHYNAAKAGVIAYMKSLALELGPYDINVNAICPTQMADKSWKTHPRARSSAYWDQVVGHPGATYEEFDAASGRENLFEHGGQPDFSEVAEGVLWLVSDRARLVTGHALPLDAGWIVKRGG
jgi:NAD(P)-dependent dehydrogenase (short-subunit alcohol dehydrogenase family)